jgi:hypothetical protein
MPPRRVGGGARALRSSTNSSPAKRKAGVGEEVEEELEETSISIWVTLKLWVAKHEKKWGAIFYAIFLLLFTLVVLNSQVILSL